MQRETRNLKNKLDYYEELQKEKRKDLIRSFWKVVADLSVVADLPTDGSVEAKISDYLIQKYGVNWPDLLTLSQLEEVTSRFYRRLDKEIKTKNTTEILSANQEKKEETRDRMDTGNLVLDQPVSTTDSKPAESGLWESLSQDKLVYEHREQEDWGDVDTKRKQR